MTPAQRYLPRLLDNVARCYDMTSADVLCFTKSPPAAYEARRVVYQVASKTLGLSTCQIADVTGDSHSGVRFHLKRAEKQMRSSVAFSAVVAKFTTQAVLGFRSFDIVRAEAAE